MLTAKKADFYGLGERFGLDPVIVRLIRNRDIVGEAAMEEYLYGSMKQLHDPHLMKGMDEAVRIIREKRDAGKKIRIIGDYDIDGICATYLLYRGLSRIGIKTDFMLPERVRDGYGMNCRMIDEAEADGIDTIVTCDNGIAACEPAAYAKKKGMTLIITDHHSIPVSEQGTPVLPEADTILNPHQEDCGYPFKELCGAAVAYKLVCALYEAEGIPSEESEALVEYAGFATVGDIMDLTGENRILVKEGLRRLNHTKNIGLRALIRENGLSERKIMAYHIGFVLGPCLNAGGRLKTAHTSLSLLLAESEQEAAAIASELYQLNVQRKTLTEEGVLEADAQITENGWEKDPVLVVYLPDCHESIAGIIAARVKEKYYRPTLIITDGEDCVKGSGRSIEGYSMFEELQKCKELFLKYGGHPMAAGFSLKKEHINRLRAALNENCRLTEEELTPKIMIDVAMPLHYISEKLIEELEVLEPCGKKNEKPVFAEKNLKVLGARVLGQNRNVLKFRVRNTAGCTMDALYFGDIEELLARIEQRYGPAQVESMLQNRPNAVEFAAIYDPSINEYRGTRTVQIILRSVTL
ncbi:MAG: single-stranded-DNA-specific exonuclease RecJ [Eubacteriales bacterium]|nr:single-stranded-DNA-specific exonuclease RecJ [Eubacteriales bacterium]